MIDDETKARTLARAIVADVVLYNEPKITGAADLRTALLAELWEGRDLFVARVVPALQPVYEQCVAEWLAQQGQPVPPGTDVLLPRGSYAPSPQAAERVVPYEHPAVERDEGAAARRALRAKRPWYLALTLLLVLLVPALLYWMAYLRH